MQPIDPQANGPQLLYGLRYHAHINTEEEDITFHDQTGYWLWEPAAGNIVFTLAIPRGQVAMAGGTAAADASMFEVAARLGDPHFGIITNPFLNYGFRTVSFTMTVTVSSDDEWSYHQDTLLEVHGTSSPFHHTDRNTLTRQAAPTPNPMAQTI